MSLRHLLTAAVDAARALLCPGGPVSLYPVPVLAVPACPSPVPARAPWCAPRGRADADPGCTGAGPARVPARPGLPGPGCAAPGSRVPGARDAYGAGVLRARRAWAWRASPRARDAGDVYMSVGVHGGRPVRLAHYLQGGASAGTGSPPMHLPLVTRTPDPVQVTDTRPGVPSVDVCHERARRTDAARFPLVNVRAPEKRPLTLRNRPVGAPFVPYDRPLSILRITDDTRVEMSGRSLVGAEHFYFVIDTWAYGDGETDVILTCERTHKRASSWIDAFGGYV